MMSNEKKRSIFNNATIFLHDIKEIRVSVSNATEAECLNIEFENADEEKGYIHLFYNKGSEINIGPWLKVFRRLKRMKVNIGDLLKLGGKKNA